MKRDFSILFFTFVTVALFAEKADSDDLVSTQVTKPGPWGQLEYFPLVLEPSNLYVSVSNDLKSFREGTIWRIKAPDIDGVKTLLQKSGIDSLTIERLMAPQFLKQEGGLYEIHPPDFIIEGLTPEQRAELYPLLEPPSNDNRFYLPFSISKGGINSYSQVPTGLPPALEDLIQKLSYSRKETVRFSDINYVLEKAANEQERFRILKLLNREVSLSVKLRIDRSSNLKALSDYWGSNGRNSEVTPLLESVLQTSGVDCLDITHLLPPVPRTLLHTYPTFGALERQVDAPDCFSTGFSFFSEEAPGRHLDFIGHVFTERYDRASRPLQFGDLIAILDGSNGTWIHVCNFIADDLVFSKSGKSMGRPWVINHIDDIVNQYLSVDRVSISFFRLKPEFRE